MVNNEFFTLALSSYRKQLSGLPSFARLVMLELYEYCDHATGTISITSLENFARDNFYVDPLRGRAQENITGDTIRNAFRSINSEELNKLSILTSKAMEADHGRIKNL